MALKAIYEKLDDVPEALREHYTENDDGKFELQTEEGLVAKSTVDEFRNNNIELAKANEALKKTVEAFGDLKPDDLAGLRERASKVDEIEAATKGKLDEAVQKATERIAAEHAAEIEAKDKAIGDLSGQVTTLSDTLSTEKINGLLHSVGGEIGVRSTALDDFTRRGRDVFKLNKESDVVPLNADGTTIFGKDAKPISMKEWGKGLLQSAPHLFEPNSGGGAAGGERGRPGDRVVNIDEARSNNAIGTNLEDVAAGKVSFTDAQ